MENQNKTLSLSILSGKGGVGKTNIALNLAFALHKLGHNTLIVDCDLGLANLDVMLGIAPEGSLHDLLNRNSKIQDVLYNLGERGLDLIPAASGVTDILELDEDQQEQVASTLERILKKYGFLILDIGAGISRTVQSFAGMTHHQIVVITPEPTSLTDGYALTKVLYTQKMASNFHIIVNMVNSEHEAKTGFERIRAACEKFLDLRVNYLGFVRYDNAVPDSVRNQTPFYKADENSTPARDIAVVARRLIKLRELYMEKISASPALKIG